jgi:hypothetical protein
MDDYDFISQMKESFDIFEGKMSQIDTDADEELVKHARVHGAEYVASNMHKFIPKIAHTLSKKHGVDHKWIHGQLKGKYNIKEDILTEMSWGAGKPAMPRIKRVSHGKPSPMSDTERKHALDVAQAQVAKRYGLKTSSPTQTAASKIEHKKAAGNQIPTPRGPGSVKEDKFNDSMAATATTDNSEPETPTTTRRSGMSKSARIIKSIYKRKNVVREDLTDWEKEDKSVKTYGKKPNMKDTPEDKHYGDNKPQARAILTGGKTLTGSKRDDIEIDPMMRNRPGQPDITKIKDGSKDK